MYMSELSLVEFIKKFPTDKKSEKYFVKSRLEHGIRCKCCGGKRHYYLKNARKFRCKDCLFETTLRSGTVMENSKLPMHYWFVAIYLLSHSKKPISALELQRLLGHKRYEPIYLMLRKLRIAMGNRDSLYQLGGRIELDESFFRASREVFKVSKQGNGTDQVNVVVMADTYPCEDDGSKQKGYRTNKAVSYLKMKVMDPSNQEDITEYVKETVKSDASIVSDANPKYNLKDVVSEHTKHVVTGNKELLDQEFSWVHMAVSNAQRNLLGIFHSVSIKYLQDYLDEFCYRFNRRCFKNPFKTYMRAMVLTSPYF